MASPCHACADLGMACSWRSWSRCVTAVAVRNVGALLDIVLLRRIEMQADATYAIKVMTRYALTAAA